MNWLSKLPGLLRILSAILLAIAGSYYGHGAHELATGAVGGSTVVGGGGALLASLVAFLTSYLPLFKRFMPDRLKLNERIGGIQELLDLLARDKSAQPKDDRPEMSPAERTTVGYAVAVVDAGRLAVYAKLFMDAASGEEKSRVRASAQIACDELMSRLFPVPVEAVK